MQKTEHDIVSNGAGGGHNGEYYHHCTKCGKSDWIASYGTFEQLDFYSTPCVPKSEVTPAKKNRLMKTEKDILQDNLSALHNILDAELIKHATELKDKYEYIKILEKRHASEIAKKNEDIAVLKEQIETLHYTVKGSCAEHLTLRVEVSPLMASQSRDHVELTRYMTECANKRMAHAVEKHLGNRSEIIRDYERALRHIHHLENQMQAYGLLFTPFGVPIKFR